MWGEEAVSRWQPFTDIASNARSSSICTYFPCEYLSYLHVDTDENIEVVCI